jgi:carboxypeptidase D
LEKQWQICKVELAAGEDKVDRTDCEQVLQDILRLTAKPNASGQRDCYNMYDVRLTDVYPSCGMNWPPDLPQVTAYLRRSEVIRALHISPNRVTGWTECNGAVGAAFRAANSKAAIHFLPDILTQVPIVLFSGAEDLICNHLGTEALIGNMEWNGGKGFEISPGNWAPRRDWTVEGEPAGFWQEARNLTYVQFYNASHMVPFDHPRRSRDMLDRFMQIDISSIGGIPIDSRLDGEKGPATSVGGAGKAPVADQEQQKKLDEAKWHAYRKSGEIVLAIVAVAAAAWGYYIWRSRRKMQGYKGIPLVSDSTSQRTRGGLEAFRSRRTNNDLEVGDFDESELDDLHLRTPTDLADKDRYSVGGDSDDEIDEKAGSSSRANGSRS